MGDDLFVATRLDKYRSLCISTLAKGTVHDGEAGHLGGDRGYFIYEVDERPITGGLQILAKAVSLEAAFRLIDLWQANQSLPQRLQSRRQSTNVTA